MTPQEIEKIAQELARLMKGANDDDAGNFTHYVADEAYDDEGKGPIWKAICARAEELLPTIEITHEERVRWARANREFNAEVNGELRQLGFGA